jgi:hypothetical protein
LKIYNSYILTVAVLLLLSTVVMVALGQSSLEVYYTVYVLEALIVSELYVYFSAKARRGMGLVSAVLFAGFLFIVSLQVIRMLV